MRPRRSPEGYITVSEFLAGRGVPLGVALKLYCPFGRRLKALYASVFGYEPPRLRRSFNGAPASGYVYPVAVLYLFDEVWRELGVDARLS